MPFRKKTVSQVNKQQTPKSIMKLPRLLPVFLFLAHFAQAAIIPVSEDTYSANNGKIARGYGKHPTLTLAPKGAVVLLRFDVNDFAGLIAADRVSSARVILDITKVRKAGSVQFHRVTSEWTESANGLREAPGFLPTPFATLPADTVKTEQFAMIDLTAEVKQWLTAPETDFGIAITSTEANLDIASKEGAAEGEPAWLEIESLQVTGNAQIAPGVDATKLGDGAVDNAELSYLNGVLSPIQAQLNAVSTAANNAALAAQAANTAASAAQTTANTANAVAGAAQTTANAANATATAANTAAGAAQTTANAANAAAAQAVTKVQSEPALRIVRGTITWANGAISVAEGSGFTVTYLSHNRFLITFAQPFSDVPTVTGSYQFPDSGNAHLSMGLVGVSNGNTTFHAQIDDLPAGQITSLHFIAIGPR